MSMQESNRGNWGGQGGGGWDRDGGRGGRDNDWGRGGRDNDWNRGGHDRDRDWDRGRHGGWDNDWNRGRGWDWDDWYKPKKHKRRYNYYPGNPWWYPYWNQWIAPIVNPIFSWFQPYPYQTTYQPSVLYP